MNFLNALRCSNSSGKPPIWIMRQAGRYLPEYRALRDKHDFLTLCHRPELAAEVTLLPIQRFGMDAAILFCDILVIPEALGVGLTFEEKKGPIIARPLNTIADADSLPMPDIREKLNYVSEAIRLLLPQLKVPLIGFCGAPFTVASYLIEGGSSKDLKKTKQWLMQHPESFHRLLEHITTCTIEYLKMQIDAGVHALQIFDSWAHVLGHVQFRSFSLFYMEKILNAIRKYNVPVILFCRGSSVFAQQMAEAAPAGISIDWQADITQMRRSVGNNIALQGNLDPDVLYADKHIIRTETNRILKGMHQDKGFIFNLGHGIHPDIPLESVYTLVECVKTYNI